MSSTGEHRPFAVGTTEHKIFTHFGDDTHVYPGHGDDTVLGNERPHLAERRDRGW